VTGEHYNCVESLAFQNLRIEYSTLVSWVGQPLVDEDGFTRDAGSQTVQVKPPIKGRMYQREGLVLNLHYSACWEMKGRGMALDIHPGAHIGLHWDSPRPLADTLEVVQRLRDFLAFATGLPTHIESIDAKPVRFTWIGHAHDMLLFHRSLAGPKARGEAPFPLFSLEDIISDLERVVSAWFEKAARLQPVIDLHLAPVYNPQMQPENQLLAAVQALEALYRRTRENRELPEDEHAARMTEILAGVPDQHRKWLQGRLAYSNEPS
ncbi:unnamed protein product, partial [marine sediment metagenome]